MSTVVIRIDGTDITDDVEIRTASFSSMVNGSPGPARIRVKDVGQTYSFNTGDSLTLDVDSNRKWGGYVMSAKKVYALSVIDTTPHYPITRSWEITGVDYNILFDKRIIWKQSDPTGKINFKYDADTYDDTIILDIFNNYLTIGGDGLSSSGVERIAKAILDVPGKTHRGSVASASYTWKQMMNRVARATGGVYYISPTKVLTYVDVETATSSYDLTDTPTDGNDIGYQSFSLLENGSDLVNDMMIWGAGTGNDSVVASRTQDAASIAAHGRWQLGLFTSGLFRQASADIIADSYVYGTPQSHRGGKDDGISFSCRVFEPVFGAGEVVDVSCGIYDYADALPIRSMTTTFASPTQPIFDLVLSHIIDLPVGITEFKNYVYDDPNDDIDDKFPCPSGWRRVDGQCVPPEIEDEGVECTAEICGITDAFGRSTSTGWTTSDSGLFWASAINTSASAWVEPGVGRMHAPEGLSNNDVSQTLQAVPIDGTFDIVLKMRLSTASHGAGAGPRFRWNILSQDAVVDIDVDLGTGGLITLESSGGITDVTTTSPWGLNTDTGDIYIRWQSTKAVEQKVKIWDIADPEPGTWLLTQSLVGITDDFYGPCTMQILLDNNPDGGTYGLMTLWVYEVDIAGVTGCTAVQFDNFNRTVAVNSWGVATPGGASWTEEFRSVNMRALVDGSSGVYRANSAGAGGAIGYYASSGGWTAGTFTMHAVITIPTGAVSALNFEFVTYPGPPLDDPYMNGAQWDYVNQAVAVYSDNEFETMATTGLNTPGVYNVMWNHEPNVQSAIKVWPFGTTEPDWLVSRAAVLNGPIDSNTKFLVDVGTGFGFGGPSGNYDVKFDSIDFYYDGRPCTPCGTSSGSAENFDRTNVTAVELSGVASAKPNYTQWGTGPLGSWALYVQGSIADSGSGAGLESGRAVHRRFAAASPASGRKLYAALPSLSGAWSTPIEVLIDWSSESFSNNALNVYFLHPSDLDGMYGTTSDYIEVEFSPGSGSPSTNTGRIFFQGDGIGNASSPLTGLGHGTFVVNETFRTRLLIDSTQMQAKLWKATSGEPAAWDLTHTYAAGTLSWLSNAAFELGVWCHVNGATYIDRVEIVGAGTCGDCTETIIDDFNRTVGSSGGGAGALGNTSAGGYTWYTESGGNCTYSVDGSKAVITVQRPGTTSNNSLYLTLNDGGSDYGPYYLAGSGFPNEVITGTEIDLALDFMVNNLANFTYMEVTLVDNYNSDYEGIIAELNLFSDLVGLSTYSGSDNGNVAFNFSVNIWYTLRMQVSGGAARIKVWATGSAEPVAWTNAAPALPPPWPGPGELSINVNASGPSGVVATVYFDNLRYLTCADVPVPVEGGSGVADSGYVCETLPNSIGGSDFACSKAYFMGSLEVWVNGLAQTGYIQHGATGEFELSGDIAAGDTLRVCYQANGNPI